MATVAVVRLTIIVRAGVTAAIGRQYSLQCIIVLLHLAKGSFR